MKKFNLAAIGVMVLMLVYIVLLIVVGQKSETALIFWSKIPHPLPFTISPWWNLLVSFPLAIIVFSIQPQRDEIIGRGYHGSDAKKVGSYEAKSLVFQAQAISWVAASGFYLLFIFYQMIIPSKLGGPISALLTSISVLIMSYVAFGFGVDLSIGLFVDRKKKWIGEFYMYYLVSGVKQGFVKTLPMTMGLTIGIIIRLLIYPINKLFRGQPSYPEKLDIYIDGIE